MREGLYEPRFYGSLLQKFRIVDHTDFEFRKILSHYKTMHTWPSPIYGKIRKKKFTCYPLSESVFINITALIFMKS